jgi:ligand-binding sensor protein
MREALKDYFASGSWKAFIEDVSSFMETSVCYLVMDHRQKLWTHRNDNPLCARAHRTETGESLCKRDYEEHLEACRLTGKPGLFQCHMGLVRIVIPVKMANGTTVFLGMCGMRTWRRVPERLLTHAATLGIPPREVMALHSKVHYMPLKRIRTMTRILEHLIHSITELLTIKEQLKTLATRTPA